MFWSWKSQKRHVRLRCLAEVLHTCRVLFCFVLFCFLYLVYKALMSLGLFVLEPLKVWEKALKANIAIVGCPLCGLWKQGESARCQKQESFFSWKQLETNLVTLKSFTCSMTKASVCESEWYQEEPSDEQPQEFLNSGFNWECHTIFRVMATWTWQLDLLLRLLVPHGQVHLWYKLTSEWDADWETSLL
jgi:hypothetical protein